MDSVEWCRMGFWGRARGATGVQVGSQHKMDHRFELGLYRISESPRNFSEFRALGNADSWLTSPPPKPSFGPALARLGWNKPLLRSP